MTEYSYPQRYNTYPWDTSGIRNISDTGRIIGCMEWYDRAKARMAEKNITQNDLLGLFGVKTRGAVGHYLVGRNDPSPSALVALADYLGMTLDEMLRGTPGPPTSQSERLDPEMIAESIEALSQVYKRRGKVFDPVQQPDQFAFAYQLRAGLGDTPSQAQLIDFGAKLAERLRATEEAGDERGNGKQAGGADRAGAKRQSSAKA